MLGDVIPAEARGVVGLDELETALEERGDRGVPAIHVIEDSEFDFHLPPRAARYSCTRGASDASGLRLT